MHTYPPSPSRRGGALLLAIAGITLLGLIGMGLTSILSSSGRILQNALPHTAYLAESGVTVLRHRLRGLSTSAQMLEIESLHGKTLTFSASAPSPDRNLTPGSVELRLYPHWFQTASTSSGPTPAPTFGTLPVHAGGCRHLTDTEHAFVAFQPDGSTSRFVLQGSGADSPTSLPTLPGATICFVGRYQSATLASPEPARWSLSLTTANPDDFQAFPDNNGLFGLIDDTGAVSPEWFVYANLHRNNQQIRIEDIRPVDSSSLEPSDLFGKNLVLGRHLSIEVLAKTPSGSREAALFALNLSPYPTPLIRIK